MLKIFFVSLFSITLLSRANSQLLNLDIPIKLKSSSGKYIKAYYFQQNQQIIVDLENKDSITHFLYDTSFKLLKQYSVDTTGRRIRPKKNTAFFVTNICLPGIIAEVYASHESIGIYKLDFEKGIDEKLAGIQLNQKYEDEDIVAAMPDQRGCSFLSVSIKMHKAIIYKWQSLTNAVSIKEIDLPKSTLSKEEIKIRNGDFLKVKYKDLFSNVSVTQINKPSIFRFPALSQLFYNDTCIYIINKTPYQAGINVFKINTVAGSANSTNYFINKVMSETQPKYLTYPVATVFDTLLIIQNCSLKTFEYYFYNLLTGQLITKYETKNNNSLASLVHSPLRQIGTFGSASDEKELDNERLFIKRRNSGLMFIQPVLSADSLILTFGSFVGTEGIQGLALSMATMGFGELIGLGVSLGGVRFIPYLTTHRNIFLYAHSKFSINGLQPSSANNTHTYLDQLINDSKMKELDDNNSLIIELPEQLYVGVYNKETKHFDLSRYQQH